MSVNSSHIRALVALAIAGAALVSMPPAAGAQETAQPEAPSKPITERDVGAADVALTPLSDLNLRKGEIPKLLLAAQVMPYDLYGLGRCAELAAAIGELDALLGDDIDVAVAKGQEFQVGRVAQSVVGTLIPFRGVIRELSGANAQERKLQAAIYAGVARRSFLKGIGQQRGCRYPARSATPQVVAAAQAESAAATQRKK